jgi:short-subunit dehydrogenase
MAQAMTRRFGGLDVLVNNAGIGATGHFAEATEERLRQIFEVNFFGLTEMTRVCLPLLQKGNTPAVVNVSSIVGKRGLPGRSEYSASKFAVQGFSEALRGELVRYGIDVLVINPGLTQTNFAQNMLERKSRLQVDHMRGMTAEQAAEGTLKAIARGTDEVTFTTPGKLFVTVSRLFPRLVNRIVARRVRKIYADEMTAIR